MATKHVLVCGAGSIGRRHIANLVQLGAAVTVWRARSQLLEDVTREFGIRGYVDLDAAITDADAVVVAVATDQHVKVAAEVLRRGRALYIEKPLSHDRKGVDSLVRLAGELTVEVGCQFRAHPNLIALRTALREMNSGRVLTYRLALGHRLDAWRAADYRECYSADAARGGGALFDLIHMIDVALWLFGPVSEVHAVLSKVSTLQIAGDDVANVLLTHDAGTTGHVQLDMASPVRRCAVEVVAAEAVFQWDDAEGILRRMLAEGATVADRVPQSHTRNDLFLAHMAHFLRRLDSPALPPLCSLGDAVAGLDVVLAARASNAARRAARVERIG